jgi:hypothetical protein
LSGEKGDAGGMAFGGVVELREAESAGSKGVEVGCFDFSAVTTDVGVTEVIDHDDDHVGGLSGRSEVRKAENEDCKEEYFHEFKSAVFTEVVSELLPQSASEQMV